MAAAAAQMLAVRAPSNASFGGLSLNGGDSQAAVLALKGRAGLVQRSVSMRSSRLSIHSVVIHSRDAMNQ